MEIPEKKVGVVYNKRTKEINDVVLEPGKHSLNILSHAVLLHTDDQQINFSFEVIFEDVTSANVKFTINCRLKIDNLSKVYQKFGQSALEYPLDSLILTEARSQVRGLLIEIDKDKITKEALFEKIKHNLKTVNPIAEMIKIKSFSRGQITRQ